MTQADIYPVAEDGRALPLAELGRRVQAHPQGSALATEASLARIDDPSGEGARAFVTVYHEAARDAARQSDLRRSRGESARSLEGLPISIKDLFDVAGEVTTAGSTLLAGSPAAEEDAVIVARLRAAGAVLVGKTNMTEFAYSGVGLNPHYGTPRNPHDPARIPGGSSAGAGVAGPYGFAAASIGTDTGGSVRIPAAFCGVVGFKPTQRRVPRTGAYPLAQSLDSVGPLAPTVECCNRLDAVMAGSPYEPLPERSPGRLTLALPESTMLTERLDAAVAAAFETAVGRLAAAGVRIDRRPFPEFEIAHDIYRLGGVAPYEALANHRENLRLHRAEYDPRVRDRLEAAAAIRAESYAEAARLRTEAAIAFRRATLEVDAVICPTVAITAPLFADLVSDDACQKINSLVLRNTALFNLLDACAISLPCAGRGELPVGLMLVGRAWTDRHLLTVARAVEPIVDPA